MRLPYKQRNCSRSRKQHCRDGIQHHAPVAFRPAIILLCRSGYLRRRGRRLFRRFRRRRRRRIRGMRYGRCCGRCGSRCCGRCGSRFCRWRCRGCLRCPRFISARPWRQLHAPGYALSGKRAVIILVYSRKKALIVIAYGAVPKPEQAVIPLFPAFIASRKRLSWFFL